MRTRTCALAILALLFAPVFPGSTQQTAGAADSNTTAPRASRHYSLAATPDNVQ